MRDIDTIRFVCSVLSAKRDYWVHVLLDLTYCSCYWLLCRRRMLPVAVKRKSAGVMKHTWQNCSSNWKQRRKKSRGEAEIESHLALMCEVFVITGSLIQYLTRSRHMREKTQYGTQWQVGVVSVLAVRFTITKEGSKQGRIFLYLWQHL